MWWDGGERAITAREKALIEEHSSSCFSIPLVPAAGPGDADPIAWVIVWRDVNATTGEPMERRSVHLHNCVADYRVSGIDAKASPLYAHPEPVELVAQQVGEVQGDGLAPAARAGLPFIAYAFAQGVDGAEEAGRAIEAAIAARQPGVRPVIPAGWKLVPEQMTLDPSAVDLLVTQLQADEDAESADDRWCGGVLWVGETVGDQGETYCGLNFANIECMEEGSLPLVEFAAPPAQGIDLGQLEHIRNVVHAMSGQVPDEWIDPIVELQQDVQKLIDGQRDAAPGVDRG